MCVIGWVDFWHWDQPGPVWSDNSVIPVSSIASSHYSTLQSLNWTHLTEYNQANLENITNWSFLKLLYNVYHGTVETVLHSTSCGREKTTGQKFPIDGALFSTSSPAYCGYSCSILGKNWDNRISWVLLIKGGRICFISISWKKLNYYGFTV